MNAFRRAGLAIVGKATVSALCAAVASSPAAQGWPSNAHSLAAEQWPSLYADAPTTLALEPNSVSQVPGLLGVLGAWFQYTHPEMSARCIPPPRACYAKAQRIYYHVNCANGSLAQIQRITFDLNGDVSSQSDADFNALYYMPPFWSPEAGLGRSICYGSPLSWPARSGNPE